MLFLTLTIGVVTYIFDDGGTLRSLDMAPRVGGREIQRELQRPAGCCIRLISQRIRWIAGGPTAQPSRRRHRFLINSRRDRRWNVALRAGT